MQSSLAFDPHIRPIDGRRDILPIADLIEMCFSLTLDHDGYEYLRQIRSFAQSPFSIHWAPGCNERVSYPLHGFVWEDNGKIVGNLNLIPHIVHGKWLYLIANVAVHPEHRRRGIARMLTLKALDHLKIHHVPSGWLHVRDENSSAYRMYQDLNFRERARRTTWQSHLIPEYQNVQGTTIITGSRQLGDWKQQYCWLKSIYPPEVAWHLPFRPESLGPNLWESLVHFLNGDQIRHWSARMKKELIGVVSWQPRLQSTDNLWIATTLSSEEAALNALLPAVRKDLHYSHSLSVNYPAGRAEKAFLAAGFNKLHTLIWMEMKF